MDGDLLLIMIGIVVLTAIVLGVGNEMLRNFLRFKERQLAIMADKAAESAAQYAARAEKLEQRVRVLERIATTSGADLAMEIEDLRDRNEEGERLQ